MIPVAQNETGQFIRLASSASISSEDGTRRSSVASLLHPSRTDDDRAAFGLHLVDVTPPEGQRWTGHIEDQAGLPVPVFVDVPARTPSPRDVINERNRRLSMGFEYLFSDDRGTHHFGTTKEDMVGWDEVSMWSNAQLATGNQNETMEIVTNSGNIQVTALEWQSILVAAAQFRHPIWMASFALQTMDPIPDNYADDSWWEVLE